MATKRKLKQRIRQLEAYITNHLGETLPGDLMLDGVHRDMQDELKRNLEEDLELMVDQRLKEMDARCVRAENLAHRVDGLQDTVIRHNKEIKALQNKVGN